MTDRIRDLPHMKELANSRQLLRGALSLARLARPIMRLARRDVTAFDKRMSEWRGWERKATDLVTVPDRFNDLFGDRGWVMYEMMNFDLATACVAKGEAGDVDGAERDLVEAITPDYVRWKLMLMRGVRAFEPRFPLAEKALADYAEGRYYASVLVTLSLLDGLVNDLHPVGFFAKDADLNAWDSVSAHSTGLKRLSRVMQEPRTKTRTDPINLPYRHGIVHGRDLGYDNKRVAAKAWVALFAVRDWALKAERKSLGPQPPKERRGLWETLRRYSEWQREREVLQGHLEAWRPRSVEVGRDCPSSGEPSDHLEGSPERAALEFFTLLRRRNYGGVARSLDQTFLGEQTINALAGDYRKLFASTRIDDVRLLGLSDKAPAISVVTVQVRGNFRGESFDRAIDVRLIYKDDQSQVLPRGTAKGTWRLVFLPTLPSDPFEDDEETEVADPER